MSDYGILEGAIDLHVHAMLDFYKRPFTEMEIAETAEKVGYRAILFKSHFSPNADRAFIINDILDGKMKVFGGIILNHAVGGINPVAAYAAISMGAKEVKMPTLHAANHVDVSGPTYSYFDDKMPQILSSLQGIRILDENGKLKKPVYELLEVIKNEDVFLSTGHLSYPEIKVLVSEARQMGVERIQITHADSLYSYLTVDQQLEFAEQGAIIEHHIARCMPVVFKGKEGRMEPEIKKVGAERCTLGSDFGQFFNPHPVDGFRMFVRTMLKCGITEKEMDWLIRKNPARLLGLTDG
ncbi:MAG: hypothetical protein JRI75_10800 [Deltaproteobacteria bacterium]|nr:hypothetical protein [Deltaproteobacteria bacterium]